MSQLRPAPTLVTAPADDGYLAYDVGTGRIHHLNPAAALVLELCDGTRTLHDIEEALRPVVADALPAVREWVAYALQEKLLESRAPGGTPSATSPDRWHAGRPHPRVATAGALADLAQDLRQQDAVLAAFICQHRASELAPDDADLSYRLGELAHIVGRRHVARAAYERYLEAHPDDAEIAHVLVSLRDEPAPGRVPDRCIQQLYARFSSFYDANMRGDLDYCAPESLGAAIARALDGRQGLRVVDLGCGTGLSGHQLRPWADSLTGVDLSPEMIARARTRNLYDSLATAEVTAYLRDSAVGPFDLIVACDTFIYFGDLRQVLAPAATRLTADGLVAFTVEKSDTYPLRLTDSGRFAHHPRHLADAADEAGLRVVSLDEEVLRYEYGTPVVGLVAVLARAVGSTGSI